MKYIFVIILLAGQILFAQEPGTKKWEFDTGQVLGNSPALGADGSLYTISNKGVLFRINSKGGKVSETDLGVGTGRPLAISEDGSLYVTTFDDLYVFDSTGGIKWQKKIGSNMLAPAFGSGGRIYVAHSFKTLSSVDSEGKVIWSVNTSEDIVSSPIVGRDETVYVKSYNTIYAFNRDGTLKWKYTPQYKMATTALPAIADDDTIYIGDIEGILYALNPDGTLKWKYESWHRIDSQITIDENGVLYFGSKNGIVIAVNPDGTKKWDLIIWGIYISSPTIGSDGTIYIGSFNNKIYAISKDGKVKWEFLTGKSIDTSSIIAPDGTLYVVSTDGKIYALNTESKGLADSSWPTFRYNSKGQASIVSENCPRAVVSEDHMFQLSGEVLLDASGSYDPDNEELSYLWRIAKKPEGSDLVLTDSTSAKIKVDIPAQYRGTYRFAVTVTDKKDGKSSESIRIGNEIKWEYNKGVNLFSSPGMDENSLYLFSKDGYLHSLDLDGKVKWKFKTDDFGCGTPLIDKNGNIYIGTYSGMVYAVDKTGNLIWKYDTGAHIWSSVSLGPDGIIYVGDENGILHAINLDGTAKWKFKCRFDIYGAASVAHDGTIYVVSRVNEIFALNSDGTEKWEFDLSESEIDGFYESFSSPAIGEDGTIYFTAGDYLFSFNPAEALNWKYKIGGGSRNSPVIGEDGTIYVCSDKENVFAINPDGKLKWNYNTGHPFWANSLAIGADGVIYLGTSDGNLFALDSNGERKWETKLSDYYLSSPIIGNDGTIYIASEKEFFAVHSESKGLAKSSWPKYMNNNQNQSSLLNKNSPQARITQSETFVAGNKVILDGTGSFDPDNDKLYYKWTLLEKPEGVTTEIENDTSAIASLYIPDNNRGIYKFGLTVTDNEDGISTVGGKVRSRVKWTFDNAVVYSEVAVDENGTAYFSSDKNKLYAVNPDGTEKWCFDGNVSYRLGPMISSDGTIFVISGKPSLIALTPEGTPKWEFDTEAAVFYSPAIGTDGNIYFATTDKKLFSVDTKGNENWRKDVGLYPTASTVIGKDGTIYLCCRWENKISAFSNNGTKKWEFIAPDEIHSSPVIDSDGTIYFGSNDYKLYALNPDGTKKWTFTTKYNVTNPAVIGTDGTIYFGSEDDDFYALNPDGTKKWIYSTSYGIWNSATIGADETIYFNSDKKKLNAFNPDGKIKWEFTADKEMAGNQKMSTVPVIGSDGTIYVNYGKLYALYSESKGLADSPWPKYLCNNRNTNCDIDFTTSVTETDSDKLPNEFILHPLYPNPFNPEVNIRFSMNKKSNVEIKIFSVTGEFIKQILNEEKEAGVHIVKWNASAAASGVYFINIKADGVIHTKKCLLLK